MTETPLNCFPMRMEWEATLPFLIAEPFPAPLIESRSSSSRTMTNLCPSSVMKLAEFAREYSWEVRTQFSQGCIPHATTGRPSALKDLIGLRFGAHPMTQRQAYAVYSRNASGGAWTWSSIMIWGPDLPPFAGCGITELKEFLRVPDRPTPNMLAWVNVIKHRREQQAAEVKARPKAPAKGREDHA
jgi:hypothetical protein